ncbi:hypothetical protein C8R46DRAFT_932425, partial [Mycena filopes]
LKETRSLISGSVPVAALFPGRFTPNDVDVYTPEGQEHTMIKRVQEDMEFAMDREPATVHYPRHSTIAKIYWFRKGPAKINLIIVKGDNAAIAVFQFHSTLVMNILRWDGLLCAYPDSTLKGIGLVNTSYIIGGAGIQRTAECLRKYEQRGFVFMREVGKLTNTRGAALTGSCQVLDGHQCEVSPSCLASVRDLYDEGIMFIPFEGYVPAEVGGEQGRAEGDTQSVEWRLGGALCVGPERICRPFIVSVEGRGVTVSVRHYKRRVFNDKVGP